MTKITPEIDAQMWNLAESHNDETLTSFQLRHPELVEELKKRCEMVASLRRTKPIPAPMLDLPVFVLRPKPTYRPLHLVGATAGLLALALGSYFGTRALVEREQIAPAIVSSPEVETDGTVAVRPDPIQSQVHREPMPFSPKGQESIPEFTEVIPPVQIRMQSTPLLIVLRAIATETKLRLEIPPGFPDPTIDVDLTAESGTKAIQELGMVHGFSAFDQGGGVILLIPAVDEGRAQDQASG